MIVDVVERWIPGANIRKDLLGIIDLLVLDGQPGCLGVQATTGGHHAARRDKLCAHPNTRLWLEASNRLEIWSWDKRGSKGRRKLWTLRREVIALVTEERTGGEGTVGARTGKHSLGTDWQESTGLATSAQQGDGEQRQQRRGQG
jgi:hypothetical protein